MSLESLGLGALVNALIIASILITDTTKADSAIGDPSAKWKVQAHP